jgi:hypothetical protein
MRQQQGGSLSKRHEKEIMMVRGRQTKGRREVITKDRKHETVLSSLIPLDEDVIAVTPSFHYRGRLSLVVFHPQTHPDFMSRGDSSNSKQK